MATIVILLLGGCSPDAANRPEAKASASASASPTPSPSSSATPVPELAPRGARSVSEQTDLYQFEYSYPAKAGNIRALAGLLDKRLDETRTKLAEKAAAGRRTAREDGFPYNKYSDEISWSVAGESPRYLSLAARIASYSGGAHGDYGFESIVWDKQAKDTRTPESFFISVARLESALRDRLCHAIDVERARRRKTTVAKIRQQARDRKKSSDKSDFDSCPGLKDGTVVLESRYNHRFNRIGVEFGPYIVGPYSEGTYKLSLRVDRKVLDAVRPQYRKAFSTRN